MAPAPFRTLLRTLVAVPLFAMLAWVAAPAGVAAPAADAPPRHLTGTLADGATWIADVPADWNGTLLLFSHGFGPLEAQVAPSEESRVALLDAGYALAGSSYDPNGSWWALASAERDQFETLDAFTQAERRPNRTIAVGQSMGGLVAAQLARDGAGRVDGALSICGLTAGGVDSLDYMLRAGVVLAKLLLPGEDIRLTGFADMYEAQAAAQRLRDAVTAAQATAEGRPRVALAAAYLNESDWFDGSEPPQSGDVHARQQQQYLGVDQMLQFLFWLARYHAEVAVGGNPSSTVGINYAALLQNSRHADVVSALYGEAGLDLEADLTAVAQSPAIQADPAARSRLTETSTAGQELDVPTLTVHNTGDPAVPVEQESTFAARVSAAGDGPLLRQAYVAQPGHCNFTTAEVVASVRAIDIRTITGTWGSVTDPWALNALAASTGLGESAFISYQPARLI